MIKHDLSKDDFDWILLHRGELAWRTIHKAKIDAIGAPEGDWRSERYCMLVVAVRRWQREHWLRKNSPLIGLTVIPLVIFGILIVGVVFAK